MTTLLIVYVTAGSLLISLSIPLYLGKIPPNPIYGFRVPKTLDNPKLWYKVNRYSARFLILTGVLSVLTAALLYLIPGISVDAYALGCLAAFSAVFIIGLAFSFRYMKKVTLP